MGEQTERMQRAFVLRDFTVGGIVNSLEALRKQGPPGWVVKVAGFDNDLSHGLVFDDEVRRLIEESDKIIALCDRGNANVGFEIGFALGKGRRTVLATSGSVEAEHLQRAPYQGLGIVHVDGLNRLRYCVAQAQGILVDAVPKRGGQTLFLCPQSGEGDAYASELEFLGLGWIVRRDEQWHLRQLPDLIAGASRVVWTIAPVLQQDPIARDGAGNTACAAIAGYAFAHGLELVVLRAASARSVADVAGRGRQFETLATYAEQLRALARPGRGQRTRKPETRSEQKDPESESGNEPQVKEPTQPREVPWTPPDGLELPTMVASMKSPRGSGKSEFQARPHRRLWMYGLALALLTALALWRPWETGRVDPDAGSTGSTAETGRIETRESGDGTAVTGEAASSEQMTGAGDAQPPLKLPPSFTGFTFARRNDAQLPEYTLDKDPSVELVLVPEGTFWMGAGEPSPDPERFDDETPAHQVSVQAFLIAKCEITNAQYERFLKETGHAPPAYWTDSRYDRPDQPVVGVSWDDAQAYCTWAGLGLPTEAQWEYACRAGSPTAYWSGSSEQDLERVGWYGGQIDDGAHPVAEKPASPWGLFDMHGNVWEWCEDEWSSDYSKSQRVHPGAYSGGGSGYRVRRGGSFADDAVIARSACRFHWHPSNRGPDLGFRPAKGITPG